MQALIRSKSAGITGGRGTAGAGPGRDLLYFERSDHHGSELGPKNGKKCFFKTGLAEVPGG